MSSKSFQLSDVLSVTTGFLVSPRGMESIYDVAGYMISNPKIQTIDLAYMTNYAKQEILIQYPCLEDVRSIDLSNALRKPNDEEFRKKIIESWINVQISKYGETIELHPIEQSLNNLIV